MPAIFMDPSPLAVVLFTLAVIGLAAGVRNLVKDWAKAMGAPAKPLSITLKTEKTPQEVMDAARAAKFKRRLFFVSILIGCWVVGYRLRPEVVEPITMSVLSFFADFLRILGEAIVNIGSQLSVLLA